MKKTLAARALSAGLFLLLLLPVLLCGAGAAQPDENIVLKMEYTFETGQPTTHSYDRYSSEYDNDRGQLTDGMYASESASALGWLSSFRSSSRVVTFDFGKTVTVTGAKADFFHDAANYHAPRETKLLLSDDGENWFLAGSAEPKFPLTASDRRYEAWITAGPYLARYVRVEYSVDVFALCDEIEVYGAKEERAGAKRIVPDPAEEPWFCSSLGDGYGITDIIKIYNGYYPADQEKADNTAGELLPYVAYLDKEGNILDTMFDAVAFVPCVSTDFAYPSGGTLVRTSKYPSAVMSDWVLYTDFLFASERDLRALDDAVGKTFAALEKTDAKFPVLLTMPYAARSDRAFGDIDGDGKEDYTRTLEERLAVVSWYDAYLKVRFETAGFKYLDFVGYYWYNETIDEAWSNDERAFTEGATKLLRDGGKTVLFDPFYLSVGYDRWREYGFTGAVMQPNVSFLKSRPYFELEMLDEFAVAAASEHLGVEIETDEPSYFRADDASRPAQYYERYLFVGAKTGYMNALHTFYQGAGPGSLYDFCMARDATPADLRLRRLYDITYQFIKGTYSNLPPAVSSIPSELRTEAGERVRAEIEWSDGDSFPGDVQIVAGDPEHGTAQILANRKTLVYRPADGFEGSDSFTVTVSDGQNEPQVFTVRVSVGSAAQESSEQEGSSGEPGETGFPYWLIAAAAALVIAASTAVIVLVLVKRKK